jgi:hypothetical protein
MVKEMRHMHKYIRFIELQQSKGSALGNRERLLSVWMRVWVQIRKEIKV